MGTPNAWVRRKEFMMFPRRHLLPLLSALALLLTPFALIPQAAEAQTENEYVVDTLADNAFAAAQTYCSDITVGDCSLRQALGEARRDGVPSRISFEVAGTINLDPGTRGELLIDVGQLTIDADDPLAVPPVVQIAGGGARFPAFRITTSQVTIRGLSITGFSGLLSPGGAAIVLDGANARQNVISQNYLGVLPDGATTAGNVYGVRVVNGASENTISGNFIGGSTIAGISIENASTNTIQGNGVGIGVNDAALRNNEAGIIILSSGNGTSTGNIIGGPAALANVISGNGPGNGTTKAGILLQGAGTSLNFIRANRIGLDGGNQPGDGLTAVPNNGDGIRIESGANNNEVEGSTGSPVLVSGNSGYGIRITGAGTNNNRIKGGVFVGLNRTRTGSVGNSLGGVWIDNGASNNSVAGSTTAFTIVAGNTGGNGIRVEDAATTGTQISGAYIGVAPDPAVSGGTLTLPNGGGVAVADAGNLTLNGNTISGNAEFGVRLSGTDTVTLTGNFVGLNTALKGTAPNVGPGIQILDATNTIVGGTGSARNYIAGNSGAGGYGVEISDGTLTTVRGNTFGLAAAASAVVPNPPTSIASTVFTVAAPNGAEAIRVHNGAKAVTISTNVVAGGSAPATPGISVTGDGAAWDTPIGASTVATVTITANRVGWTTVSSTPTAFPNGDGILLTGGVRNVSVLTNTLLYNLGAAVRATDVFTADISGNTPVERNLGGGILVGGSSRNLIVRENNVSQNGRTPAGAVSNPAADGIFLNAGSTIVGAQILSNTIRANTGRGIALAGDVDGGLIRSNFLALNGKGIELAGTTRYSGSGPDPDTITDPNHGIDPPIVDASFASPLALRVDQTGLVQGFVLTSTTSPITSEVSLNPVSACEGCSVQLFRADPEAPTEEQGWELITTLEPGTFAEQQAIPASANGAFSAYLTGLLPQRLMLVATDRFNNSSEYSSLPLTPGLTVEGVDPQTSLPLTRDAAPAETVTYTLRLSNPGNIDFTNMRIAVSGNRPGWQFSSSQPINTDFRLNAKTSQLVTFTLTLPPGTNENAKAGVVNTTRISVTGGTAPVSQVTGGAELITTVLPRPVLTPTSPLTSTGSGRPGTAVPHSFTVRNDGNVTVTLTLERSTVDATGIRRLHPDDSPVWLEELNATTITIAPGAEGRIGLSMLVPAGAQENAFATTFVTATVQAGTAPGPVFPGGATLSFTATTRADLNPNADLYPDLEREGGATGLVPFTHTVENKSNGTATFCLDYFTSNQSTVTFESATSNFTVTPEGCFTLYAEGNLDPSQGRFKLAQIRALVRVNRDLFVGTTETVTIFLRQGSPTGPSISDAVVENRILVNSSVLAPRVRLPLILVQRQ
jgi:parallel beta-helix repeat protein